MEPSNQGTADQQWSEARAYWNTLRSLWAIQAQNRDVIDPALSQPTPGEFAKSVKLNTHIRQVMSVPAMWLQKYSHVYRLPTTLVGRCLIILELAWASSTPVVLLFVMAHRPCMHAALNNNKLCQSGQLHRYALKFTLKSWGTFWAPFMHDYWSDFNLLSGMWDCNEQPAFSWYSSSNYRNEKLPCV